MFFGRSYELEQLEKLSKINKASLVICKGRRRIGKSRLIEEYGKKFKTFIRLQGLAPRKGMANKVQLDNFCFQLSKQSDIPNVSVTNWAEAFTLLCSTIKNKKVLLLLDEISWMGNYDRDFPGLLKNAWDMEFKNNNNLQLVLCGSVSSWIEENIINSTNFMGRISKVISLQELSLTESHQFWGKRAERVSSFEKFKLLSITGGVPRYLEEINYRESAEENIKSLCFEEEGVLYNEFDDIFNDIFGRRSDIYKKIVMALVDKKKTFSEICKFAKLGLNGVTTKYLLDLELAGFIEKHERWNLNNSKKMTGKSLYRLKDNYLRFYLKYIYPKNDQIKKGIFRYQSVESFTAYETIMGFQLENLILNNLPFILKRLGLTKINIINAAPYFQFATQKIKGCQIDLLIQGKSTLYLCECKYRKNIGISIVKEVKDKIKRLKRPLVYTIRPILIYVGHLDDAVIEEDFFDKIIPFENLL